METGYGTIKVIDRIDLTVNESEIVAVIGPNGAGKTTLLKAVCGLLPQWSGGISLWGEAVPNEPPYNRVRRGVGYVPEGARVFGELTVEENLEMGAFRRGDRAGIRQSFEMVFELFPVLRERLKLKANLLSGGQRQMLAISRGLVSGAKLLLLDEPSLGLAPILVEELFDKLTVIRRLGTTILLVEQNARKALQIADRAYVMAAGKFVARGSAEELRGNQVVETAFVEGEA